MAKSNPRRGNSSLRNTLRERMRSRGLPCAICGRPIDYDLPSRVRLGGRWVYSDWAFELDEIWPVSKWREGGYDSPEACANDPENHQPTHRICNRMKGNKVAGSVGQVVGQRPTKPTKAATRPQKHSQEW